ncbi:GNAT family N-acetyltransferase [Paenibacillus allorhizosphaerae]|uniref:GNAT family N-acetyltransferase n=1 Tax=Paenibacillus allorhizosphaerae TaxID=2849866 RepID=UPI001C407B94|nr:GNAT family N-acetyltransferase [Paenibacillus allorhizosphaerae]
MVNVGNDKVLLKMVNMDNYNFWQGETVRLRGIEPSDAETMFQWNVDSDAIKRVDAVLLPRSYENVKNHIEESSKKGPDGHIGIYIARPFWNKGYGREVVQ